MSTEKPKMFESLGDVTLSPTVSDSTGSTNRPPRYGTEDHGGHAVHFLERLDRASGTQAELALQLYNNPEVLRFVLKSLKIPEEFDRVAVSLHEADSGPYLVASRKGRFVTCLGEGMAINNLYFISHSRLLNHIEKNEEYRHRKKLAHSLVGEKRQLEKLFARIANKGDNVTREEMLAISAMQPALKMLFINKLLEFMDNVSDDTEVLTKRKRFTSKDRPILKRYYGEYRAIGHLALLSSMSGPGGIEGFMADNAKGFLRALTVPLFTGDMSMLLKLVWFVGKMGRPLLPELKRMFLEARVHEEWVLGLMGLITMGVRHGKTRGEVLKTLKNLIPALKNYSYDVGRFLGTPELKEIMLVAGSALLNPDKSYEWSVNSARNLCFKAHQPCDFPAPYTWEEKTDIPQDLAFAVIVNSRHSFSEHPELLIFLLGLTPWLARCEAEDFYHPHDYHRHVYMPWQPEDSIALIDQDRGKRFKKKPVKVERTPARNDPCPCGSGKKYKRCCLST